MKKILNVLFLLLILTSCGSETQNTVSYSEADLLGVWHRTYADETIKGREFLDAGKGFLGNYQTGSFSRAGEITWELNEGKIVIVQLFDEQTVIEEVIQVNKEVLIIKRLDTGEIRNFEYDQ